MIIPAELSPTDQAVAKALEENGFYYDGKTEVICLLPELPIEEFIGWEIQVYPVFAVAHKATGHYWLPQTEVTSTSLKEIRQLIKRVRASS